jgi:hypothetical protein
MPDERVVLLLKPRRRWKSRRAGAAGTQWSSNPDPSKFSADADGVHLLARRYLPAVIEGGQALFLAETGEAFR